MFLYTTLTAVAAVILAVFISVCAKKNTAIVYSRLDKLGRITNIILLVLYFCFSPMYLFLGMISAPAHDGILGIVGWIVSIFIASTSLFCGVGLGYSVYFRRRGKSKLSFAIQFLGVLGIGLAVLFYILFAGNLLQSLN